MADDIVSRLRRFLNPICKEHHLTANRYWRRASCPICHPETLRQVGSLEGKMPSQKACEPLIAALRKRLEADRG